MSSAPAAPRSCRPGAVAALTAALLGAASGCAPPAAGVVRVVDGQPTPGRAVTPAAYGAYARAAWDEAHGELAAADAGYRAVLAEDAHAARAWVRLGAVTCRRAHHADAAEGRALIARSRRAFDAAEELAPDDPALWVERARCELLHDRPRAALLHARRAAALEAAPELGELVAEAALGADDAVEARRWVVATLVAAPHRVTLWELARTVARALGDGPLLAEAERRLDALGAEAAAARPTAPPDWAAVDAALARGDLAAARRLALGRRLPPGALALRAAALACPGASELAAVLLAADPTDGDAAVAALVTAGTPAALDGALRAVEGGGEPSPLGVWLLAELLQRRTGSAAARAWLTATAPGDAPTADPLVATVRARVERALGAR